MDDIIITTGDLKDDYEVIDAILKLCDILLPNDFKCVINNQIELIKVNDGEKIVVACRYFCKIIIKL